MIKPAFDITATSQEDSPLQACTLLLELSEKQFTCAWVNRIKQQLFHLRQYHIPSEASGTIVDLLQELVESDPLLQQEIKEAIVIYNLGESSLVPDNHYSVELGKPLTEVVSGNAQKGLVLSEKIPGHDMFTIYRIPREVHSLLQRKFSAGKYWHYYSLMLSVIPAGNVVRKAAFRLFFYPDKLVAAVFKEGMLQLVQSCFFQVPEDIAYFLLNICKQLGYSPEEVHLLLSGLIDVDSAMYSEIARYFLEIEWDTSGTDAWHNDQLSEYPGHYFSPILQMALCV
jgi:hypothetical protein